MIAQFAAAQGYICAEGGGSVSKGDWSPPMFKWMVDKARLLAEKDAAELRVVIIGSREVGVPLDPAIEDPTEPADTTTQRFKDAGATNVRAFWINSTNSADETIAEAIRTSHIIWLRGGSQSRYCEFWKSTPVEAAMRAVFARGGVVGGTSAGCAVLGEFIYDAEGGSCMPMDALRDPYSEKISFTSGFLEFTPGVIFDTHFAERARFTRLAVFLGRIHTDNNRRVVGIGVDTRTALCIGPDGQAEVIGTGAVCIMHMTSDTRLSINKTVSPAITDIATMQLVAGQRVNLRQLVEAASKSVPVAVAQPHITGRVDPLDKPHARGDAPLHAARGRITIAPNVTENAVFDGTLEFVDGTNALADGLVVVRALVSASSRENAAGGLAWALANEKVRWGVLLDSAAGVMLDPDGVVRAYLPLGKLGRPLSSAIVCAAENFKPGPKPPSARQAGSFSGARTHILADRWGFDVKTGRGVVPTP